MASGKALKIAQAIALTQDSDHCNLQQVTRHDADALQHPGIRDGLEEADQSELGYGRKALVHSEEAIQQTKPRARSPGKEACDGLSICPAAAGMGRRFAGEAEVAKAMAQLAKTLLALALCLE